MTRRRPAAPAVPEQPESGRTVLVPIAQFPHLAEGARRSGHTARVLRVHIPDQHVKTPNRRPGQWLASGEPLKPVPPHYLSATEIAEIERGEIPAPWEGGFDR